MPDSSHFGGHEIPPQPKVDFESVLEKGEIRSVKELEGYWGMQLVEIKDDGDALFRPDKETDFMFDEFGMESRRSDLELLAYKIDQILEFNLVPTVTTRTVGDLNGSLQRRIQNFYADIDVEWSKVKPENITQAAVFDYLLDVQDRHSGNFLIDSDTDKLWLIDHDFYMFFKGKTQGITLIIEKAQEKGLINLSGTELASLERFLAHVDLLTAGAKPEVIKILEKARDRAKVLLEEGKIPINT